MLPLEKKITYTLVTDPYARPQTGVLITAQNRRKLTKVNRRKSKRNNQCLQQFRNKRTPKKDRHIFKVIRLSKGVFWFDNKYTFGVSNSSQRQGFLLAPQRSKKNRIY